MSGIRINKRRILDRVATQFEAIADEFDAELHDSFDDEVWQWPRLTDRRSGEIAGSPRDITDTGALQASQTMQRISRFRVRYRWGESYASLVLTGYRTSTGANVPPRNWIRYTVENKYNPGKHLRRRLDGQ